MALSITVKINTFTLLTYRSIIKNSLNLHTCRNENVARKTLKVIILNVACDIFLYNDINQSIK